MKTRPLRFVHSHLDHSPPLMPNCVFQSWNQIPWPSGRRSDSQPGSPEVEGYRSPLSIPGTPSDLSEDEDGPASALAKRRGSLNERATKKHMSTMDLFALSISMAGAQIIWTMELGCVHLCFNKILYETTLINMLSAFFSVGELHSFSNWGFRKVQRVWYGLLALSVD